MSVIVWDGKTLAADRQSNYGECTQPATKIFRAENGNLLGCVGSYHVCRALVSWYNNGCPKDDHPNKGLSYEDDGVLIAITPKGIDVFAGTQPPYRHEHKTIAYGSGMPYALAALAAGAKAQKAVEITNELCSSCGLGVDTLVPYWPQDEESDE